MDGLAFRNDRFLVPRLGDDVRAALRDRGLPVPAWDAGERVWALEDDVEAARAVRFLHEGHHFRLEPAAAERIEDHLASQALPSPARRMRELEARLRPYQRAGVDFLVDKRRAFLADGMGLGKTLQALMALERQEAYPAVVVCPASVKLSWRAEVLKWLPWRGVQVLMSGRETVADVDIVLLNPELLGAHLEDLFLLGPRAVVLDEAHFFKNPGAQRTQLAEELASRLPIRYALSGTPIPNRRQDLIQQLTILGQLEEVLHVYRGVLPHWWSPGSGPLRYDHAMNALARLPRRELHKRLKQVCFLRRTKDQVHDDLPAFHRSRRDLALDAADAAGYKESEKTFIEWVREHQKRVKKARQASQAEAEAAQAAGADAGLLSGFDPSARFRGRQHLSALRREAALAKIPAVVEWAQGLDGERAVYFAHHKQVVHALAAALPGKHAIITGDVPVEQRQHLIDSLPQYDGLVATMDSSGQGVDGMQVHARHVVFIELDWTPTKHEQCEGRLHRIGQKDKVEAWYFTAQDTIDAAMMRRLEEKWEDVQGILDGADDATMDRFLGDVMDRAARGRALWYD
ncbi:MAG: DEAD/DEAH box helicase [Thermoplasmatota archaeon]